MSAPPGATSLRQDAPPRDLPLLDLTAPADGRYDRQTRISWWDQRRLAEARVLVVGAGALGNEIIKGLALTGVGRLVILDLDRIETSNLARSVLFRDRDVGARKAERAAQAATELNPDVRARGLCCNVTTQAGLGLFAWADVVIGGLDNREARVFVNRACAATGRVWVDGAIEALSGVVRAFDPASGPCYECTMNAVDRRLLAQRRSCAQLARAEVRQGHVPATAVTASVIAGLQVTQAIKLLHGQPALVGHGLHFDGLNDVAERVRYPRRDECPGHDRLEPIRPLNARSGALTLRQLLERAEATLGAGAVLDLSREVVTTLSCPRCGEVQPGRAVLGGVDETQAACPGCGAHRVVDFTSYIGRDSPVDLDATVRDLGLPPFDLVVARQGAEARQAWLFDGDADEVLGPLR